MSFFPGPEDVGLYRKSLLPSWFDQLEGQPHLCHYVRAEDAVAADLAEVPEDRASEARGDLVQHAIQRLCPVRRFDWRRLMRCRGLRM